MFSIQKRNSSVDRVLLETDLKLAFNSCRTCFISFLENNMDRILILAFNRSETKISQKALQIILSSRLEIINSILHCETFQQIPKIILDNVEEPSLKLIGNFANLLENCIHQFPKMKLQLFMNYLFPYLDHPSVISLFETLISIAPDQFIKLNVVEQLKFQIQTDCLNLNENFNRINSAFRILSYALSNERVYTYIVTPSFLQFAINNLQYSSPLISGSQWNLLSHLVAADNTEHLKICVSYAIEIIIQHSTTSETSNSLFTEFSEDSENHNCDFSLTFNKDKVDAIHFLGKILEVQPELANEINSEQILNELFYLFRQFPNHSIGLSEILNFFKIVFNFGKFQPLLSHFFLDLNILTIKTCTQRAFLKDFYAYMNKDREFPIYSTFSDIDFQNIYELSIDSHEIIC